MPISLRSARRLSRLYSAIGIIRLLLTAYRAEVQLRSIFSIQIHMTGSSFGQITSGPCRINSHLMALTGTPGPAHGEE